MKATTQAIPAVAGGIPTFEQKVPIVSPEGVRELRVLDEIAAIIASGQITNGARVRDFEQAAAEFLGVPHCVAVSSCTSGLMLSLRALGLTGEVILPSFTFHATAHAAVWNGLKPVFADCHLDTFCLDPASVRAKTTPRTSAILAVHMYGHPADVAELEEIAARHKLALIFDAAHAFGSAVNGTRVGGFGTAEVFSFSPTKLLVAAEGGLVATRDAALARTLRAGRNYGDAGNYDPDLAGLNARMSELHATLALHGLPGLGARITRRNEVRRVYERCLRAVPGLSFQTIRAGCTSTCKDFSVLVDEAAFGASRDWLVDALLAENIEVKRYFYPPVHRQRLYRGVWDGQPLPATDAVSNRIVSLPIYSSLSDPDAERVAGAIARAQAWVATHPPPAQKGAEP
jgi:dTDP-4-amino-4,6-dideoxygalactose transaminase